jgi:hypothetical protein
MDRLARKVTFRWKEAKPPSKSPRAPTKFQPRIKEKDWVDVTDPDDPSKGKAEERQAQRVTAAFNLLWRFGAG